MEQTIEISLNNAQNGPHINIIIDGIINEQLPVRKSITKIFPQTDGIQLFYADIVPHGEGYLIKPTNQLLGFSRTERIH